MQQPPLSQRIKEIQRQLDVQLFRRKARGVDLTEAGRVSFNSARTMLADYERALHSPSGTGEHGEPSMAMETPGKFFRKSRIANGTNGCKNAVGMRPTESPGGS